MREIKFRAWNEEEKHMYEVLALYFDSDGILKSQIMYHGPVMQYTGLKDKNGKEIYEGDIVTFHAFVEGGGMGGSREVDYDGQGVIEYRNDGMTFVIKGKQARINELCDWLVEYTTHFEEPCIEIIGNIYENPELLDNK